MKYSGRLLIVTPTLGCSAYWSRMLKAVDSLDLDIIHVCVGPAHLGGGYKRGRIDRIFLVDEGGGMYAAINQGIKYGFQRTDWDWFTYLNDDDELSLDHGIADILTDSDQCIYGRCNAIGADSELLFSIPISKSPCDLLALCVGGVVGINQQGWFIHRRILSDFGLFDQSFRFTGDFELLVRLLNAKVVFRYDRRILGLFRVRDGQLSKNKKAMAAESKRVISRCSVSYSGLYVFFKKIRFRIQNLNCYYNRVRRYGFRSVKRIYES